MSPSAPATRSLIFRIAGHEYISPVNVLREVVPCGGTTRIPGAPTHVIGLMNMRGTIVTVIDGGIYLHNTPSDRQNGAILLIDMGSRSAGILVDRVIDIRLPMGGDGHYHPLDLREVVSHVVMISENV